MSISEWPADERPREKLLQRGAAALTDAELLAIFLRTGVQGKSAVDLARDLLERFGDLRGLLTAERDQFCSAKGLGPAKYTQLQAVMEMSRRYLDVEIGDRDLVNTPELVRRYLKLRLHGYPYEVFACLFLDTRSRVILYEELFRGTLNQTSVHPREVVRRALALNAAAVIFAHNHPSGSADPSSDDLSLTRNLKTALELFDIAVADHFVVGDGRAASLRERGYL